MNKIALFDMDGSLANYDKSMIRDLRTLRCPSELEFPTNLHQLEKADHWHYRMTMIKSQPGWWLNLEPIPQGILVAQIAKDMGFDIHILTKGPLKHPNAWSEKVEWCHRHLDFEVSGIHITTKKGLFYGSVLYDDYPVYMEDWLAFRARGLGIMPVTAHNESYQHQNVVKWDGDNIEEIITALRLAYDRESGEPLRL